MRRGEIWWGEAPDTRGHPYLIASRDAANEVMRRVVVAPVTRTVRDLPSEVALGPKNGLPVACAASFDNVQPFAKSMLVRRLGALGPGDTRICQALHSMAGC